MKRLPTPLLAFLTGSAFIASFHMGILTWAQGWEYASSQFIRDRRYVMLVIFGFGVQAALYSILRFRHFAPVTTDGADGTPLWFVRCSQQQE